MEGQGAGYIYIYMYIYMLIYITYIYMYITAGQKFATQDQLDRSPSGNPFRP